MKIQHFLVAAFGMLLINGLGCATVARGDKQKVTFTSEPPAAKLIVDGKAYVTPAEVTFKRKEKKGTPPHEITIAKEGYRTITFKFQAHWDGGGVGAVALDAAVPGGSAMFLIDLISGADHQYDKLATIKLLPVAPGQTEPLVLYDYKGKLLEKPAYDEAVEKDKLFKGKKKDKDGAATQPAAK